RHVHVRVLVRRLPRTHHGPRSRRDHPPHHPRTHLAARHGLAPSRPHPARRARLTAHPHRSLSFAHHVAPPAATWRPSPGRLPRAPSLRRGHPHRPPPPGNATNRKPICAATTATKRDASRAHPPIPSPT